jgi:hypothetical protein
LSQLFEIIKSEGRTIIDEFNLASKQGKGTAQEVADFREHAVQSFLGRFYPINYIVSKGKVTDLEGRQSNSIDCLILNPAHPNLVDSRGKFRLNFSDGCDAAIEVKPDVARTDELHRGLEQCVSVKKILRSKSPILNKGNKPAHIVEHSLRIPFFIFTLKSFSPVDLCHQIADFYRKNETPLEDQIDGICISNVGFIKNVKHKELNVYGASFPIGKNDGWYLEKWGESALLGLLLNIEYTFSSQPGMTDSIMKRVLTRLGRFDVERIMGNVQPCS